MTEILDSPLYSIAIGVLLVALLCYRQLQSRSVKEDRGIRAFVIIAAVGAFQTISFLQHHSVDGLVLGITAASLLIGLALGALRGTLVHVWRADGTLMRRGNAWTIVIWVAGLAAHVGLDLVAARIQPSAEGFGGNTLLLYIALSLAAQKVVVLRRAQSLAEHPGSAPTAY